MSAIDFHQKAEQIAEDNDAQASTVHEQLTDVKASFPSLPDEEVVATVRNRFTDDDEPQSGNETVTLDEVEDIHAGDGEWVDIDAAQVMSTWTIDADSVAQKAEIADETDRVTVTIWDDGGDEPTLEEGDVVSLENVVTDEYQGSYSVNIPSTADVQQVDVDINPDDGHVTVTGQVVKVKDGSGLIRRCTAEGCNRTLDNGRCKEHGEVESEFDIRIQAVIDDGESPQDIVIGQELTEDIMDTTLEAEVEQAMDSFDLERFGREIADELLGTFLSVKGPDFSRQVLAEEYVFLDEVTVDALDEALVEARSLTI